MFERKRRKECDSHEYDIRYISVSKQQVSRKASNDKTLILDRLHYIQEVYRSKHWKCSYIFEET